MNHKILIVEDEEPLLKILKAAFVDEGFEVLTAKNGSEALDIALQYHPELIVLDLMMPVMDGHTMLGKLRNDEWGHNVPVMVLTNAQESEHISEALNKQVTRYLIKSDMKLENIILEAKNILKIT